MGRTDHADTVLEEYLKGKSPAKCVQVNRQNASDHQAPKPKKICCLAVVDTVIKNGDDSTRVYYLAHNGREFLMIREPPVEQAAHSAWA
jgi:hypothetical protein